MTNLNIPEGYQTVMPYLILRDANGFLDFTKKVFNATEKMKHISDEQLIMHAEIQIDGSTIMFAESTEDYPPQTAGLFVYVKNADETYQTALNNGATSILAPRDQDYGRSAGIKDPCGNTWWITTAN
jgi:PhnB protein